MKLNIFEGPRELVGGTKDNLKTFVSRCENNIKSPPFGLLPPTSRLEVISLGDSSDDGKKAKAPAAATSALDERVGWVHGESNQQQRTKDLIGYYSIL